MTSSRGWSTPEDIAAKVRRGWDTGALLSAYARDLAFEPISVPLRGPSAGTIAGELDQVQAWVAGLQRGASRRGEPTYRLEHRSVGGRLVGSNQLPSRAWVESYAVAWRLLGVEDRIRRFEELVDVTRSDAPELVDWVNLHPMTALEQDTEWQLVLGAARWLAERGGRGLYVRQIDVPGVDTKFVERRRALLADLVDELLAAHGSLPAQPEAPRSDPALRYGFRTRAAMIRLRFAPEVFPGGMFEGLSEVTVRADELATLKPCAERVFLLENEVTYLAFPVLTGSLVVFGSGYLTGSAGSLPWLVGKEICYWGDLDTHGFSILNRLRHALPDVRSFLMDRATLLDHRSQWVTEPKPTRARLDRLTTAESDLYRDLVEDTFGPAVRLEQERVRWSAVEAAIPAKTR